MEFGRKVDIPFNISPCLPFPRFEQPEPVGFFSINGDRNYVNSAENMKYYVKPSNDDFPLDLNLGLANAVHQKESTLQEGLNFLLHFIQENYEEAKLNKDSTPSRFLPHDFLCYRGLLTLIGETPFENYNNWTILVTRFKGNFYMCRLKSDDDIRAFHNETKEQKRFCSWGYKFEQYCLSETPDSLPTNASQPVNENEEFNCVFQSKLGPYRLFYGAELDGVLSDKEVNVNDRRNFRSLQFIELKTRERDLNDRKLQTFRNRKALKWWLQSFLVGIKTIAVGLRDSRGLVRDVAELEVNTLRKMTPQNWSGTQCFVFILNFLNMVQIIVGAEDDPQTTYEFSFIACDKEIYYKKYEGFSKYTFLTNSYIEFVYEQCSKMKSMPIPKSDKEATSKNGWRQ